MQIVTWNVNGLRSVLRKGALDWVQEARPDLLLLQEIKARPEQITTAEQTVFGGYQSCWNPAERSGYSGVATFGRSSLAGAETGLGRDDFDREGRTIWTRHGDFHLFNIYFPNGGRGKDRVDFKLEFYAHLLEICDRLHAAGEQVVIAGDFNTAHREIDLKNPRQNETTSGFLPEERAWIDRYLEHGLVDAYRYLYPEKVEYTWWTYRVRARERNIGWRLDYFLVSEGLMPRVRDVVVHGGLNGSDHCPVSLFID